MKSDYLHIADAEMEIMKLLWQWNRPVTVADIILGLAHKKWKPSTIHTLAGRLIDKGIINSYQLNGNNYYFPMITEFDYRFVVTKDFLNITHCGNLVDMVQTLLCDWDLTWDVLIRLRDLINEAIPPSEAFGALSLKKDATSANPDFCLVSLEEAAFSAGFSFLFLRFYLEWLLWVLFFVIAQKHRRGSYYTEYNVGFNHNNDKYANSA